MEAFDCIKYALCDSANGYESSGDEIEDKDAVDLTHVADAAYNILRRKHNRQHHALWNVTSGAVVGALHQTPRGAFDEQLELPKTGHDEWFPEKVGEILGRTEYWADVLSLGPPDGRFLEVFQRALAQIAARAAANQERTETTPVVVRIMLGNIIGMPLNCNKLIRILTAQIAQTHHPYIRIWVGAWRRGASWNHAKIVAVDGRYLHTGGHNLWDQHYLAEKPVHDLGLELAGRVAHDGHLFANAQWEFVRYKQDTPCGQFVDKLPDDMILIAKTRVVVSEFPPSVADEFPPIYVKRCVPNVSADRTNHVPIITMGRYGTIHRFARPSDDAFCAMLSSATRIIRCALQDLGPVCVPKTKLPLPGCVWPQRYLECMARVMYEKEVDIEIVLSNPGSIPGNLSMTEACYGNGWSCVDVAAHLIETLRKLYPQADDKHVRKIVNDNLRVCFLRQAGRGNKYEDGMTIGLHTKHFIVDDVCTYIGSQNMYICDLAEWGVVLDGAEITQKIMTEYWNPMWKVSYTGEDCDVHRVMDSLKMDRETTATIGDVRLVDAKSMQAHGSTRTGFYLEVDEEKE